MRRRNLIAPTLLTALCGLAVAADDPTKQPNHSDEATAIRTLKTKHELSGSGVSFGMIEQWVPLMYDFRDKKVREHIALLGRVSATEPANAFTPAEKARMFAVRHACSVAGIMIANDKDPSAKNGPTGIAHKATLAAESAFIHPEHLPKKLEATIKVFRKAASQLLLAAKAPAIWNISWGIPRAYLPANQEDALRVLADWVASSRGVLIVCAAGNNDETSKGKPGILQSPQDGFNVLTVGATGETSKGMNYGVGLDTSMLGPTSDGRAKPDLVAPGTSIYSTVPLDIKDFTADDNSKFSAWFGWDYRFASLDRTTWGQYTGTSFAAPHVAGIAGLLSEAAGKQGWPKADADAARHRMTMRAVLINGTSKQVRDKPKGKQWKDIDRPASQPLDHALGAGQVNAVRSHEILTAGAQPRANAASLGWSLDKTSARPGSVVAYKIKKAVRADTHISATVVWERPTKGEKIESAEYEGPLPNLDLEVFGSANNRRSSTSKIDSVEHVYHKNSKSETCEVRVVSRADKEVPYAVAWHTVPEPDKAKEHNGRFDGERRAPCDDGWRSPTDYASIDRRDWMPGDAWDMAACLTPAVDDLAIIAQQTPRPTGGFRISFDAAFSKPDDPTASLRVYLGNVDLTTLGGFPQGITADTESYEHFTHHEIVVPDGDLFDGLDDSTELTLVFASMLGTEAYVDNVEYSTVD